MARGISIRDVTNKIRIVRDNDVLPVSTGDNQPEVVEIGVLKNHIIEDIDIPEIEAISTDAIARMMGQ